MIYTFCEVKFLIIKINNVLLENWNKEIIIVNDKVNVKVNNLYNYNSNINKNIKKINSTINIIMAGGALVSGDLSGLDDIIKLLQEFSYYIGMGYCLWGCIEYSMDVPSGATKMKRAITGFIGVYIIPIIFKAIKNALS